ncbi:MAG: cupin domain-containing protein [Leptospiraceae bacterium]|nr:cupin domain-containing protein [Leptospiraceae bacterium]
MSMKKLRNTLITTLTVAALTALAQCQPDPDDAAKTSSELRIITLDSYLAAQNPQNDRISLTEGQKINALAWHLSNEADYPFLRNEDQEMILLVARGSLRLQLQKGKAIQLSEGEIVFVPAGRAFQPDPISPNCKLLVFHAGKESGLRTFVNGP